MVLEALKLPETETMPKNAVIRSDQPHVMAPSSLQYVPMDIAWLMVKRPYPLMYQEQERPNSSLSHQINQYWFSTRIDNEMMMAVTMDVTNAMPPA
jgi:hypothetical protein